VRMVVMVFVSDDHNAEAGEAAVREIVAHVVLLTKEFISRSTSGV
jgi:hypothetical protein